MDLYAVMAKMPVFRIRDVSAYYNSIGSARSAVKSLMSHGRVLKIRNDLYTCVSMVTGGPVADRFQIASSINASSYVSHHSAFEYYGITDQVFNEVHVSSETRFRDFDFDGYTFHYIKSRFSNGVDMPRYSGGIKVTDKERTLIDSIKDLERIMGPEELISSISVLTMLDESKLLCYLSLYDNQFLYQKSGYLLSLFKDTLHLSKQFFEECRAHIGKSHRYLMSGMESGKYDADWSLIVPEDLLLIKNGERIENAAI